MAKYVALLKGVNVGGNNRVSMGEWCALLSGLRYTHVSTLLNSGNAVFSSAARSSHAHATRIRSCLAESLGVDVPVIVRSAKDVAAIISGNALVSVATDPSRLLVAFANDSKALAELEAIRPLLVPREQLHIGAHAAYLWCANKINNSKAASALLGKFGRAATTRNWATVLKINALLSQRT